MATVKNIGFQNYCDTMYRELSEMKRKLLGFVSEIEHMKDPEKEMVKSHISHYQEIARFIDWKLEILTKVCPFEWSGYSGVERTASVRVDEEFSRKLPIGSGSGDVGG